jgi:hypothetical protein
MSKPGTERRRGAGPAGDLPVHPVQGERHDGEGDEHGDRHRPGERVGGQRRHPADERRPGEGDPVGRAQPADAAAAAHAAAEHGADDQAVGGARQPPGDAEAAGELQVRQQRDLGDESRHGTTPKLGHRTLRDYGAT